MTSKSKLFSYVLIIFMSFGLISCSVSNRLLFDVFYRFALILYSFISKLSSVYAFNFSFIFFATFLSFNVLYNVILQ